MTGQQLDHVSICINEKLGGISSISSECCIFKVIVGLRRINDKAYDPIIVAIGPYHCSKDYSQVMEQQKLRYLQMLFQRREEQEQDVTRYVMAMRKLEKRARKCYEKSASLNEDQFVEMMLLDVCFIVELAHKFRMEELIDENDPIFDKPLLMWSIGRDMVLLENQLPFFVLWEFFSMTAIPNQQDDLIQMLLEFIYHLLPGLGYKRYNPYSSIQDIKHILSLLHDNWLPSPVENEVIDEKQENWKFIRCATELKEAGIKFTKVDADSVFVVKFKNGILEIPALGIQDHTESLFRNLIAYEQHHVNNMNHVIDYIRLMDCLINTPKNVELLSLHGIIDNWLGDDEVIATMFNRLLDSVAIPTKNIKYAKVFNDVNAHCSKRSNKWIANLRHNYFNSPWAHVSFWAAFLLLMMTVVQTIFSVMAYFK